MCDYIEFVADRLLIDLGCKPIYATPNPFPWMDLISVDGKTNFFDRRVGEYANAKVRMHRETPLPPATSPASESAAAAATLPLPAQGAPLERTFCTDAEF
jgi:hypothetical protein